jgi:saccharopine dehydrogenase-like NADP-dependent oxidoreductase
VHGILVLGCGKIGRMIAKFLSKSGGYQVTMADSDAHALERVARQSTVKTLQVDAADEEQLAAAMRGHGAVISALSFRYNPLVARAALATGVHYFDLTEDVETTQRVREVAARAHPGQLFVPQCGLAPGFVSIAAHHLTQSFEKLDTVRMRVGALPQFPSNALKYNLTWSTDGLINEYCNPCEAIHDGHKQMVLPLEGLEHFSLDGVRYEAFNTSGGLGSLCETLEGRVRELNYKTIRYLGHRELAWFLVNELRMSQHREQLKEILERAVPVTFQDVVVVFCTVSGWRNGQHVQLSDARKIYHQTVHDEHWSAIQITTAAGVCTMVDLAFSGELRGPGFVRQESVPLTVFLHNRFGRYYEASGSARLETKHITEVLDGDD